LHNIWPPYLYSILMGLPLQLLCVFLVAKWLWRRKLSVPEIASAPDWSGITDYAELARCAGQAHKLSPDAFLDGPIRRFLEISSNPNEHPRARARMMEFCRAAFIGYLHSQAEHGANVAEIRVRGRALAGEWFCRSDVPNGDYMLEVFDGYSTHNYRGCCDPLSVSGAGAFNQ
jgi:hypothetical protein